MVFTNSRYRSVLGVVVAASLGMAALVAPRPAAAASHTITYDELLADDRRPAHRHLVRRVPPVPAAQPDPVARHPAEDEGRRLQRRLDLLRLGLPLAQPGVYDFTGVRDMDQLLDMAQEVGLYVIARPGPYINAEIDGGGFPGWLTHPGRQGAHRRRRYLAAADEWLTQIDAIIARHQLTNGTRHGDPLPDRERAGARPAPAQSQLHAAPVRQGARRRHHRAALPQRQGPQRLSGCRPAPTSPGTVHGPVDLYAFDGYPGGTCHIDATPARPSPRRTGASRAPAARRAAPPPRPNTPGFAAEFGGGWFDSWGSVRHVRRARRSARDRGYERVFYGTNIANRLTLQNFYMTFGGTSWGWLPAPVVYTSYDYGAAINEARQLRPKAADDEGARPASCRASRRSPRWTRAPR